MMKKIFLAIYILMFFISVNIQARGLIRERSILTTEFNINTDRVWAVLQNFCDMSWHLAIAESECISSKKKRKYRLLTLKKGGNLTQILRKYDDRDMFIAFKTRGALVKYDTTTKEVILTGRSEFENKEDRVGLFSLPRVFDQVKIERLGHNRGKLHWKTTYDFQGFLNNIIPSGHHLSHESPVDLANSVIQKHVKYGMLGLIKTIDKSVTKLDIQYFTWDSALYYEVNRIFTQAVRKTQKLPLPVKPIDYIYKYGDENPYVIHY